jgi:predicted DNA-binding WGR domain protein
MRFLHKERKEISQEVHPMYLPSTKCSHEETGPEPAMHNTTAARKKLWEVHAHFHCSIIGTCLTNKELQKIVRKSQDVVPTDNFFSMHGKCVQLTKEKNETSRAMHKLLERKYRKDIRCFSRAGSQQEVETLWNMAWESGEFQGAYWAVMTHPESGDEFLMRAFGRIHMLGHGLIRDQARSQQQENKNQQLIADLQQRLSQQKKHYRNTLDEYAGRIRDLKQELADTKAEIQHWQSLAEKAEIQPEQIEDILSQNKALQLELEQIRKEQEQNAQHIQNWQKKHEVLKTSQAKLKDRLRDQREYARLLEDELRQYQSAFGPLNCPDRGTDRCPGPSLCGRRVLYVGGVKSMVPHYKKLVEDHGGCFLYHDGGNENSSTNLPELTSKADAVVCALNCVSHDAVKLVKDRCKQHSRQCLFLRTSSLSCLHKGLRDIQGQN